MGKFNNPLIRSFFTGRKVHLVLHIAAWTILFILPTYLLFIDSGNDRSMLNSTYIQISLYAVIFYANYLLLSPQLFNKRRKALYFIAAFPLVAVATNEKERKKAEKAKPDSELAFLKNQINLYFLFISP
jgi:hypothetical protein